MALILVSVESAAAASPTYRESPSSTWYPTNGAVLDMAFVGDKVVVGGSFTRLRNRATGQVVSRSRLAAFSRSGTLLSTFAAGANNTVEALETDGTRVFAGGAFTSIGGLTRNRMAALDATTGAGLSDFWASASASVLALEYYNGTVYLGGRFGYVNGARHVRLAAIAASTGALRTGFTGSANNTVRGLAVIPRTSALAVGGAFTSLGGASRRFLGSVWRPTGRVSSWAPRADCDTCTLLGVTARTGMVYGAVGGRGGGRASAWSSRTGQRRWSQRGDGDVQAVALIGSTLYAGGHFAPTFGRLSNGRRAKRYGLAAMDAATGRLKAWSPTVTGSSGVWVIKGDAKSLWIGGGYTRVNGHPVYARLTRFSATS